MSMLNVYRARRIRAADYAIGDPLIRAGHVSAGRFAEAPSLRKSRPRRKSCKNNDCARLERFLHRSLLKMKMAASSRSLAALSPVESLWELCFGLFVESPPSDVRRFPWHSYSWLCAS